MGRLRSRLFLLAVSALTLFASVVSASACAVSQYQTEVPEMLRK
ncbi:MAG: AgrD family cyclic lactone autoinducer peptide [Bacillota bacterium]